jgi:hypothetical protein
VEVRDTTKPAPSTWSAAVIRCDSRTIEM